MDGPYDLETVVRQYEMPLLRYVGQLLGPGTGEVEDVVQDTFLKLHAQVVQHGSASVRHVQSWLFRVAHNLAMDTGRRRRRRSRLQEQIMSDPVVNPEQAQAAEHPAGDAGRREAWALACREVQHLPDEQRQVLLLKIMQGFTLQEISDITGMKIGTVNYRLTQALRDLAQRLKEAGAI